jgi:DUF1009 family protein
MKHEIKKVAIIAGAGLLPLHVYEACLEKNIPVVVVGFEGETSFEIFKEENVHKFPIHKVSKLFKFLKEQEVSHITLAGKVRRADLTRLLLDPKGAKLLAKIIKGGLSDNSILTTILKFFESEGYEVIGPDRLASKIIVEQGNLTKLKPSKTALNDIKKGVKILKSVSEHDVGQALVIQAGLVLGVEAAEGTNELMKRCGEIRQKDAEEGPVLIKICKPQQDTRVDLPCIGPKTIEIAKEYGFSGIVLEAGKTLILNHDETIKLANSSGVFICGV